MPILRFNYCNELLESITHFNEYVKVNIDKPINISEFKQNLNQKIKYSLCFFIKIREAFKIDCDPKNNYINKLKKDEYDIIIEIFNELNRFYWNLIHVWNDSKRFYTIVHKENFKNEVEYLYKRIFEFIYFLQCIYTLKTDNAQKIIQRINFLNRRNRELNEQLNSNTRILNIEFEKRIKEIETRSQQEIDDKNREKVRKEEENQELTQELEEVIQKLNTVLEQNQLLSKDIEEAQIQIRILAQEKVLILFKAKLESRKRIVEESHYKQVKKIFENQFSDYITVGNRDDKITKINDFYIINNDNKQPDELEVVIVISDNESIPNNEIKSFYSYIKQDITKTDFRNTGHNFMALKKEFMEDFEVILINERLPNTLQ